MFINKPTISANVLSFEQPKLLKQPKKKMEQKPL